MKRLIIIILICIFSFLLNSCDKKETILYRGEKTSSGFKWEKTRGDNSPQYKGATKREYIIFGDSFPEGFGSLIFHDGSKYEGEFKNGKWDGQGTLTLNDGASKYVG